MEALQQDPTPLENLRVKQIVDHYERIIRALFLSGDSDIILPAKIQRENVKCYAKSKAVTEYVELQGRSHYTVAQPGWEAVADLALNWATQHATVRS